MASRTPQLLPNEATPTHNYSKTPLCFNGTKTVIYELVLGLALQYCAPRCLWAPNQFALAANFIVLEQQIFLRLMPFCWGTNVELHLQLLDVPVLIHLTESSWQIRFVWFHLTKHGHNHCIREARQYLKWPVGYTGCILQSNLLGTLFWQDKRLLAIPENHFLPCLARALL